MKKAKQTFEKMTKYSIRKLSVGVGPVAIGAFLLGGTLLGARPVQADQVTLPASKDHSHEEGCSPFCLCATCPGFTVPQPPQLMAVTRPDGPIIAAAMPHYQAPQSFDVPGRIWQPPRLG